MAAQTTTTLRRAIAVILFAPIVATVAMSIAGALSTGPFTPGAVISVVYFAVAGLLWWGFLHVGQRLLPNKVLRVVLLSGCATLMANGALVFTAVTLSRMPPLLVSVFVAVKFCLLIAGGLVWPGPTIQIREGLNVPSRDAA
jgi:hypothetical protein